MSEPAIWKDTFGGTWEVRTSSLTIMVHRPWNPGAWYLVCPQLHIDQHPLDVTDVEAAKTAALVFIRNKLYRLSEEVKALIPKVEPTYYCEGCGC